MKFLNKHLTTIIFSFIYLVVIILYAIPQTIIGEDSFWALTGGFIAIMMPKAVDTIQTISKPDKK